MPDHSAKGTVRMGKARLLPMLAPKSVVFLIFHIACRRHAVAADGLAAGQNTDWPDHNHGSRVSYF